MGGANNTDFPTRRKTQEVQFDAGGRELAPTFPLIDAIFFGFFGIFVTFAGIIYIYIRQIMEIRKENNVLRDYSRQTQGLPPAIN